MLQNLLTPETLIKKIAGHIKTSIANLVPCSCLLCGDENNQAICMDCHRQFFSATPRRCTSCALPLPDVGTRCGQCLSDMPAFHRTTVACDYIAPLDQLILDLKFGHQLAVAPVLAKLLAQSALLAEPPLPELIIPVPLSRNRLAERGFNQALEIARPFAKLINRPLYPRLLLRVRDTTAQTLLHPIERQDNIRLAFALCDGYAAKIQGRHIGVVDDVMTTGATLHEIATCLLRQGARQVSNFVFARTPPPQ